MRQSGEFVIMLSEVCYIENVKICYFTYFKDMIAHLNIVSLEFRNLKLGIS